MKSTAIRSILVASDFSSEANHAASRAALLAREHDAALRLLTVVRENLLAELRRHLGAEADATQRLLDGASLDLEALAARLPAPSQPTERLVRRGDVVTEILAASDHSDLLVLGAHGLSPTRDALIGTTAERLLLKGRRPMLVVRKEPRDAYQRILVAVDFSLHSIHALEFAARIAPGAQLHAVHAYDYPYESLLRSAEIPEDSIRSLPAQFREEALTNVRNILEKAGVTERASSNVVVGNPRHVIHSAAAEREADLIVLGKHGHSALGELFLGGVTRQVLSRANCDVAVIPDYPRP